MIQAEDVTIDRGGRTICHGMNLTVNPGQVVGVVGPNGSGKTTFLLSLNRALRVAGGRVLVDGDDVTGLSRREIARRVAVVAQENEAVLPLTVRDSVALGRLATSTMFDYGNDADAALVDEALARVELTGLADRLVTRISGGERQRAMVARAIAQQASHLLLDEPTNHLDLRHQFALLELVRELDCTTVIVLHDLNMAARFCDEVMLLADGHVVASGKPADVLTPERIAPVYRMRVDRVEHRGRPYLLFDSEPRDAAGETPDEEGNR